MEKPLAEQYLDGDIEVEEYTAAVIKKAELLAKRDLEDRTYRLVRGIGSAAVEEET